MGWDELRACAMKSGSPGRGREYIMMVGNVHILIITLDICGNSIANMSSTLLYATVRSRSNAIQSGSLENKVVLLRPVLSGSIDCVLFRICGKRRDVDRSSRIVFGVQREALARGQVQNVIFDSFCDEISTGSLSYISVPPTFCVVEKYCSVSGTK